MILRADRAAEGPLKGAAGTAGIGDDYDTRYGFHDSEESYDFKSKKGIDHEVVEMISQYKKEPEWMREMRHKALDTFLSKPMPRWGNSARTERRFLVASGPR